MNPNKWEKADKSMGMFNENGQNQNGALTGCGRSDQKQNGGCGRHNKMAVLGVADQIKTVMLDAASPSKAAIN